MAFVDRLSDATTHHWYMLLVEGIPQILTSLALPPAMIPAGRSQVLALDVSGGVVIPGQRIDRKSGGAQPTTMEFSLGPDDAIGTLRRLFARQLTGTLKARLTATLGWTGATITVDSTAPFPAAGNVYLGRENIAYTGKTPTTFTGCTRGQFGSLAWRYSAEAGEVKGSRAVTDHPTQWEGRRVWLWTGICSATGEPIDAALLGANQRVIWSGRIVALNPGESGKAWVLEARSIDSQLETEVGAYQARGALFDSPTLDPADPGANYDSGVGTYNLSTHGMISAPLNVITFKALLPGSALYATISATVAAGYYADMRKACADALNTALGAAGAPWNAYVWKVYAGVSVYAGDGGGANLFATHGLSFYVSGIGGAALPAATWKFRLPMLANDPLRSCGFDAPMQWENASDGIVTVIANSVETSGLPPLAVVQKTQTQMIVFESPDDYGAQFASSGAAILAYGKLAEVFTYSGLTVQNAGPPRKLLLTGLQRGACGTGPLEIAVSAELAQSQWGQLLVQGAGDIPSLRAAIAFTGENVISIFLKLCLSTGSAGLRHATYDAAGFDDYVGAGLDALDLDIARFEEVANSLPANLALRSIAWSRPFELGSWARKEFAALGYALVSRETAAGYQITLDRIRDPMLLGQRTLGDAGIVPEPWPRIESRLEDIVNRVALKLAWDPAGEKVIDSTVTVNDVNSQVDYGPTKTLSLEVAGLIGPAGGPIDRGTVILVGTQLAASLLAHFSRRYEIVTLYATKTCWTWRPGDGVAVTLPGMPRDDGGTGWSAEPMILLATERSYAGIGRSPAAKLTLLHLGDRRLTYYVPSGRIGAYNPAGPTITIDANAYTLSTQYNPVTGNPANDVDWFDNGMTIRVQNMGDEEAAVIRTIAGKVGQVLTLDLALPGGMGVGSVICYPTWATASATQRLYCYIADATTGLLPGSINPYQYAP